MAKPHSVPSHAVHLTTFAELEPYVRAFGAGHLNLLMIFGPPGVGKSRSVRQALGSQVCWIGGQATPFGIYLQAYEHRHKPIVLDDVDGLYADRLGIRLLKALGQTERTKTLSWQTAAPTLDRQGVPRQFTTTSRVALIGNDWKSLNADVAALEDRGHFSSPDKGCPSCCVAKSSRFQAVRNGVAAGREHRPNTPCRQSKPACFSSQA